MEPRFVDIAGRQLFCLRFPAQGRPRRRVLIAPPFGEELNKSRRLLALAARACAAAGGEVLLPDLYGTGDSAGLLEDARWQTWASDLATLDARQGEQFPVLPAGYLAVRSGALLLAAARPAGLAGAPVLLWQPTLTGARFLEQFMRVRIMAARMAGQSLAQKDLDAELDTAGRTEVAGYMLARELVQAMRAAALAPQDFAGAARVTLVECSPPPGGQMSMPSAKFVEQLATAGIAAEAVVQVCEQFWATQEVAAPAVLARHAAEVLLGADA